MRSWKLCRWMIAGTVGMILQSLPLTAAPATTTASVPAAPAKPVATATATVSAPTTTATTSKPAAANALPLPVQSTTTSAVPVTATASATTAAPVATATPSAPVVANPDMVCPVLPDEKADTRYSKILDGKIYYFCCARCLAKFSENPQPFIAEMQNRATLYASGDKPSGESAATVAETIASVAADGKAQEPLSDNDRILRFIGYFHPLLVHFPIALVFTAALAEFFLAFTGRRFFAPVSLFSIRLAAALAILTALSGWAGVSVGPQAASDGADWILNWHRWLGIGTAVFTTLVAIISLWITHESDRLFYRWMVYLAAAAVAVTGHFGGMLVYGQNYFRW